MRVRFGLVINEMFFAEDGSDMEEEITAESKVAEKIIEEGDREKDEAASDVKKD